MWRSKGGRVIGRLILVRHGEVDWNAEGRAIGQADPALNERGLRQAQRAGPEVVRRFDVRRVWTSDLRRCVETAHPLRVPFEETALLREWDFGEWSGLLRSEIRLRWPAEAERDWFGDPDFRPPGGERRSDLLERAARFAREMSPLDGEGDAVVVGHGGSLRGLLAALLGLSNSTLSAFSFDNASISVIEQSESGPRLSLLNYTDHLLDAGSP